MHICHMDNKSLKVFGPFKIQLFVFLLLNFLSSLYILLAFVCLLLSERAEVY
jgi:hypothetical protein